MKLKQAIKERFGLSDKDFSSWQSDLYVRAVPGLREFLNEVLEHPKNVTGFKCQVEGDIWFDIPFHNDEYWERNGSL